MIYTLTTSTCLGASRYECWEFLKNPENLNLITPPELHFRIISDIPATMFDGMLIEYSIRVPGFGQQKWLTEIKHIMEYHSFVDEQRYGPFRFWYHFHGITESTQGLNSVDHVTYIMPFGYLGRLLHAGYVRKVLLHIFRYRKEKLKQIFPP